jgi:hypothetical protein
MPDIVGTGYDGRADIIRAYVHEGMAAFLMRDPYNQHDENAIAVFIDTPKFLGLFGGGLRQIGYVDKERAAKIAPLMDIGQIIQGSVRSFYTQNMKHPRVTVSWTTRGMKKVK